MRRRREVLYRNRPVTMTGRSWVTPEATGHHLLLGHRRRMIACQTQEVSRRSGTFSGNGSLMLEPGRFLVGCPRAAQY